MHVKRNKFQGEDAMCMVFHNKLWHKAAEGCFLNYHIASEFLQETNHLRYYKNGTSNNNNLKQE